MGERAHLAEADDAMRTQVESVLKADVERTVLLERMIDEQVRGAVTRSEMAFSKAEAALASLSQAEVSREDGLRKLMEDAVSLQRGGLSTLQQAEEDRVKAAIAGVEQEAAEASTRLTAQKSREEAYQQAIINASSYPGADTPASAAS